MPNTHLIELVAPSIAAVCRPGQFIMVSCGDEFSLRRPISIHRIENSGKLSILFNIVGRGSRWLSERKEGEKLDILGPLGNGFNLRRDTNNILLVAGGIGIAPFVYLADQALSQDKSVVILMGASTAECLYPLNLLPQKAQVIAATEDGSTGNKGMVTDFLPDYVHQADQICGCGPLAMYETMSEQVNLRRFNKVIDVSLETRMGCGVGACYGCSIKTKNGMKSVCRDGPVFSLDEILWQEVRI